jgi:hypothetical protein
MSNATTTIPEVGMGATIILWSDRLACTIVEVSKSGKRLTVRRDKTTRIDGNGMSDSQKYEYEPDPQGSERTFSLRSNGRWVQEGETMRGGTNLAVGVRREYYDFSF